jgi:hypothetical protein
VSFARAGYIGSLCPFRPIGPEFAIRETRRLNRFCAAVRALFAQPIQLTPFLSLENREFAVSLSYQLERRMG